MMKDNKNKSFDRQFEVYKKRIEQTLQKIAEDLEYPHKLLDSVRYSLMMGGKRLRPVIFYATLNMLKRPIDNNADLIAASIECIHTYSLIHDDLPCMDNDSTRRGQPTNHILFGQGVAMLAGSALLNLAYELMFRSLKQPHFVYACHCIAAHAGGMGMIGGQIEDIALDENPDAGKLLYIYQKKTAALFSASFLSASLIACVDKSIIKLLGEFGFSFGMAFQIKDDLDEFINGNPIEDKSEKFNWVVAHGENDAVIELERQVQKCRDILKELKCDFNIAFLNGLLDRCFA
ncbi:MAG: polyprenyl synthetase family protein [Clostridiales bacterium]|jgi:geranylgeranyl diphosphate synthase type II|nr:polyprenyl synthetase family protein [Clostridiales bacterium]